MISIHHGMSAIWSRINQVRPILHLIVDVCIFASRILVFFFRGLIVNGGYNVRNLCISHYKYTYKCAFSFQRVKVRLYRL